MNLVVANDRRSACAADVMMLVDALAADPSAAAVSDFAYVPPADLAALQIPGAHVVTERLLLPSIVQFERREPASANSEDELQAIVDGYIKNPSPPDDDEEEDWWWALDRLVSKSPREARRVILRIIARGVYRRKESFGCSGCRGTIFSSWHARFATNSLKPSTTQHCEAETAPSLNS